MKITKLHLKDFQQFKDLTLDFTHPETGEPLDRVCFIGSNGTGKTTILEELNRIISNTLKNYQFTFAHLHPDNILHSKEPQKFFEIQIQQNVYDFFIPRNSMFPNTIGIRTVKNKNDKNRQDEYKTINLNRANINKLLPIYFENTEHDKLKNKLDALNHIQLSFNSLSYVLGENPPFLDVLPSSSINEALNLFEDFPISHKISNSTINDFWQKLIYHIKKRENDRATFENTEKNLNKTKRELIEEFDENEPNILEKLAILWNNILERSNLYFDYENARNPIQLTDNLAAYIKSKTTDKIIPYNKLSTGIKNFIFQLGHLKAIHFNRKIDNSFLLVDEPSQGLYPDFVYDLVEMYENVVSPDTQIFMATHNPIVAAQFHPYERFILSFDETGYVTVKRGESPIGDDPNDILKDDFLVENLMPKQGLEAWQKYKDLKREIHFLSKKQPKNGEREKLDVLIKEMSDLGSKYHF